MSKNGFFLQDPVDRFDAPFFSITAREAAALDPMKRILLELSYEALENGNYFFERSLPIADLHQRGSQWRHSIDPGPDALSAA